MEINEIKEKVIEIQPLWPDLIDDNIHKSLQIFLAGTIDMGNSRNWQKEYIALIKELYNGYKDLYIYNPRRDTAFPTKEDPFFEEKIDFQVNWELDHLEKSNIIIMNILPDSKSPISLMELGAFGRGQHNKEIYVICPKKFYRYNNVQIFCERYGITLFTDENEFKSFLKNIRFKNELV